jgi:glutathione S-transferase
MAYTLITANRNYSSWSLRPWVLMKALGIAFQDRVEPFREATNYPAFRAFSPTGQVPALIDGDRTIWDSMGIILYLAERHGGVWPKEEAARAFAQCAAAEMHSGFATLRNDCPMNIGVRVETFGAVDAFFAPVAFRVRTYGLDVGPVARRWVDHMLALPAMLEWERAALAETWREESHEADVGAAGRIVEDHRAV